MKNAPFAAHPGTLPPLGQWQAPARSRALQELWLNLLGGNIEGLAHGLYESSGISFSRDPAPHPMRLLQTEPTGLEVFARLGDEVRVLLLEHHLTLSNIAPGPIGHSFELAKRETERQPGSTLGLPLLVQAFWRGDWITLERLGTHGLQLMQQSIQLLLRR